jgi:hypothetical protein
MNLVFGPAFMIYRKQTVSIYDSNGQLMKEVVLTGNTANVDVRSWAAGIYFVRYGGEKGYVTKIMKY